MRCCLSHRHGNRRRQKTPEGWSRPQFRVTHAFARTFEKACRIVEPCAEEKPDIYVYRENIDVTESRITNASCGMAIVQKFTYVIPDVAHQLEPWSRNAAKEVRLHFKPPIDVWIVLGGTLRQFKKSRRESIVKIRHPMS